MTTEATNTFSPKVFFGVFVVIFFLTIPSILSYHLNSSILVLELDLSKNMDENIRILFNYPEVQEKAEYYNIKVGHDVERFFKEKKIKQLYKTRFFERREMFPLLIKGHKIKRLTGGIFNTDEVELELEKTTPDFVYGYYIDERFGNFFGGG